MTDYFATVDRLTDAQCRYALRLIVHAAHVHGDVTPEVCDAILTRAGDRR